MKPILIILAPSSLGNAQIVELGDDLKALKSNEDYYIHGFINVKDEWDFKLLNGTKENYDQLPELLRLLNKI